MVNQLEKRFFTASKPDSLQTSPFLSLFHSPSVPFWHLHKAYALAVAARLEHGGAVGFPSRLPSLPHVLGAAGRNKVLCTAVMGVTVREGKATVSESGEVNKRSAGV